MFVLSPARGEKIVLKTGGTILLGSASAAQKVALKSDLDTLKTWLTDHVHTSASPGNPTTKPTTPPPTPVCASKVKAE